MRKFHLFSICILGIVAAGCKQNVSYNVVTKFPIEKNLTAKTIHSSHELLAPANILISEDKLIVLNREPLKFFSVYQLPECNFLFEDGIKGRGPNEFMGVNTKCAYPIKNGLRVLTMDHKWTDVLVDNQNITIINQEPLDRDEAMNGFLFLENGKQCTTTDIVYPTDKEFVIYSPETKNRTEVSLFPDFSVEMNEKQLDKATAFFKNSVAHPNGDKFVSFYVFFKHFRIFDSDGNLIKEVSIDIPPTSSVYNSSPKERYIYYGSTPRAIGEYIYVICRNHLQKDSPPQTTELQVWDWNGEPVAKYTLDKPISYMVISPQNKKLYGISTSAGNDIYVYDL